MIYACTWTWLAVDGPGGVSARVSTGKWTGKEIQQRCRIFSRYEASAVTVGGLAKATQREHREYPRVSALFALGNTALRCQWKAQEIVLPREGYSKIKTKTRVSASKWTGEANVFISNLTL